MDSSGFRNLRRGRSDRAFTDFRSVVGFWGAAMQEEGCFDEMDQQIHYLLALCYALIGNSKSLQRTYRDAFLGRGATDEADALPDEIQERIRVTVDSRNRAEVQRELDETLGRFRPASGTQPLLQQAFRHWVGSGVSAFRQAGNDGLECWLSEVDRWLQRYRRRSGRWVRHFIDVFAYECKAAFYTCYANAWASLVPWLREHRGLDELSERFLRFWHNQQQPVEIPHGRTAGGVWYPTSVGREVAELNSAGQYVQRGITCATEQIGPTHLPDVFSGQVLSLHPLSGFFMKDAGLCAIAGRFFGSEVHDRVFHDGAAALTAEYWDLVGAILSAAHLYRRAQNRQEECRGSRTIQRAGDIGVSAPTGPGNMALLTDFLAARSQRCPGCEGPLEASGFQPVDSSENQAPVDFVCVGCQRRGTLLIDVDDLDRWGCTGE